MPDIGTSFPSRRHFQSQKHQQNVAREIEQFRAIPNVHDLPRIYHYWAGRYLIPAQADLFGAGDITQVFADNFLASAQASPARFLSLGSGDRAGEIEIARRLRPIRPDFTIECTELSPTLLEQARAAAREEGVSPILVFTEVDINRWRAQGAYSAVMAHHWLHHIVELEHVFDQVRAALPPHGRFIVSDMIGRNGHMRWPEAEVLLQGLWRALPPSKRYNHQLARFEPTFVNWDCAQEGFEGVRAQDILPLMLQRFEFPTFLGFGNLTDVFLDRTFGHNFDSDSARDREFIDRIHAVSEFLVDTGYLKPTMMIAVATHRGGFLALAEGRRRFHREWRMGRASGRGTANRTASGCRSGDSASEIGLASSLPVDLLATDVSASLAQDARNPPVATVGVGEAFAVAIERLGRDPRPIRAIGCLNAGRFGLADEGEAPGIANAFDGQVDIQLGPLKAGPSELV